MPSYNRSIPDLLGDVVNNFTLLVRKETQLARVEMSEKLGDLALGIGLLVGGAILLIPALVFNNAWGNERTRYRNLSLSQYR